MFASNNDSPTMAKRSLRQTTPRETNSKSNPNRSHNRGNPMITKAGVTRSGRRSFENGGKTN